MSRKWWTVLIVAVVIVGLFAAVKLLPLWATLMAAGTYFFGCFSGYILKKKEIIEKVVEKPVEVVKTITKTIEVPVETIVYVDRPVLEENKEESILLVDDAPKVESSTRSKRRRKSKKVAE